MAIANRLERGQYYKLSVGDGGSPEVFEVVSCLSKKELTVSNNIIDGTSDCGPDFEPGFSKSTFALSGFVDYNTAINGNVSAPTMFELINAATKFNFRIEPVDTPISGDQLFEGYGFFANYKQTWDTDTMIGFDCDLQVKGNITQTITP